MSDSVRRKVDLDYSVLHRTGRRVPIIRESKMASPDLQMQAINIGSDMEDLFDSYQIDELVELNELSEFVAKVGDLKRDFRRIHAQLKVAEGRNYVQKYPEYENQLLELNGKFKTANDKLNALRNTDRKRVEEIENLRAELESEKIKQETQAIKVQSEGKLVKCKSEWTFFIEQVNWELGEYDWKKLEEFDEVKIQILKLESHLEKFYKICSDVKGSLGDETASEFGFTEENDKLIDSIRKNINSGKIRVSELKEEKELLIREVSERVARESELAEIKRKNEEEFQEKEKIKNLMSCADNLYFEIKMRHDVLMAKYAVDITKLSDYEILDLKKREDSFQTEITELREKVSSFLQFVLPCGDLASVMCEKVTKMRTDGAKETEIFLKKVQKAIQENDISERKLKNSAGLKIELPKFKGYYSDMNIYTFRSEFKKLVEPNVQICLRADYLKRNFLTGAAYNLVSKIEDINDIWEKLIEVYGNTQLLFQNKVGSLEKFSNLEKLKDDEKIAFTISSMLNVMADLSKLALDYDLEGDLYHGGCLQRILDLMGRYRERKFIKLIARDNLKSRDKWKRLVIFLKDELKEREAFILNEKSKKYLTSKNKVGDFEKKNVSGNNRDSEFGKHSDSKSKSYISQHDSNEKCVCHICGKTDDHVTNANSNGKSVIEYVACKTFVDLKPRERDKMLFKRRLCSKCLKPGIKWNYDHFCDKKYSCNQIYVKNGKECKCEKHVLVCGYHADEKSNKDLLELYKKNVIKVHGKFRDFSKEIKISCFSESYNNDEQIDKFEESSIFAFQTIDVENVKLNIFYDSGCGDLVVTKECIDKLKEIERAKLEIPGPLKLNGVADQVSICEHGAYSINLPLANEKEAKMSGLCVDNITVPFPRYPLKRVEEDFREKVGRIDSEMLASLPRLPAEVGGKVDVMIGKQYLRYFPKEITQLESGLTIYKSRFKSPDGTDGIIAGPHAEFTKIDRMAHFVQDKRFTYVCPTVKRYNEMFKLISEVPFLGNKHTDSYADEKGIEDEIYVSGPRCLKRFDKIEKTGTDISYRCMRCRNCLECKNGSRIEEISIQEEVEQDIINKSVIVDIEKRICTAKLPFIADPDSRLVSNFKIALKQYNSQIRKLEKSPNDRRDVIGSEDKMQKLAFVDYLDNIEDDHVRNMILNSCVKYFIPWHAVWSKSISTPVRVVFDASRSTASGCSLNDILAKGSNNMNNLVQILIRWTIHAWAFHTDVRKMYNAVLLDSSHWKYQLYLWQKELDPSEDPRIKYIRTLIYGVRSSGNQAERAIRLTAEKNIGEYPKAYKTIQDDIYVDDCISGAQSEQEGLLVMEELKLSLEKGNFALKGYTRSGMDPDDKLSADKEAVSVGGLKWYPKEDYLMINVGELNFSRKVRGRKCESGCGIPESLTMRDCISKVAELFDPLGRVTPIIVGMKLDCSYLQRSRLDWDDKIPDNLRNVWTSNFEMIEEIGRIKYKRAIVPPDAKNLDIVTIDKGDASSKMICAAIYARFEKKDGSFSCQLVFARSKVLPEGTTTPRGELLAACMNAATGYTVSKAFGDYHKDALKLTDSTVVLHWIACKTTVLKSYVRTRVVELLRVCKFLWRYVESANMLADLGTRKGAKIADVVDGSPWINGLSWMSKPIKEFPVLSVDEIKLSKIDVDESEKEKVSFYSKNAYNVNSRIDREVKLRYQFSEYLIDPNRFRFRKVVRVLGLVLTFVKKISKKIAKVHVNKIFLHDSPGELPKILEPMNKYVLTTGYLNNMGSGICVGGKVIELSVDMIRAAMYYFSSKTTLEVKHFLKKEKYINKTREVDGVLYYSGRIPSNYAFDGYPELCEAAIDLSRTTFCVPVMDQYSPVAISIAMEIHWYHPDVKHTGIEPMWRQTQNVAHIFEGRNLVNSIKLGCQRCRVLNKASIDVVMGPIQNVNLCIAPAFYASQIDIFGPFKSYSNANKRATVKVWFLIFCCCTTGAIDVRVMEDYSTDSFIQSFIRFSCRFGYPQFVLPDEGSQLVKGCENMNYSYTDSKQRLSVEYGVQYIPCPVGAHYVHGKVERKIRQVKKCVRINVQNDRLSIMQWETLMQQISNSINNLPIGLRNKTENIEDLDIITPNRLILGRNNERCPNAPLRISGDCKKLIENNANIFRAWFKAWLVGYVPSLIERPKWHKSDENINIGDIVLFLKSDKEFDEQYQYGKVCSVHKSQDGHIRRVDVQYRNYNETVKRVTQRGVRDLVIVHPVDELDIYERLDQMID